MLEHLANNMIIVLAFSMWVFVIAFLANLLFLQINFRMYLSNWRRAKRSIKVIKKIHQEIESSPDYVMDEKTQQKYFIASMDCEILRTDCRKHHFPVPIELGEAQPMVDRVNDFISSLERREGKV